MVPTVITLFEGAAGTGKTTALIAAVDDFVARNALAPHERVLGLTFMHGARKRLASRLAAARSLGKQYECSTIDSLACRLVRRWRVRTTAEGFAAATAWPLEFERTCSAAAALVNDADIARWLRRSYPVLVVDEMQDCKHSRFHLLRQLAGHFACFVAADEFQDLASDGDTECLTWLRQAAVTQRLDHNHRTSVPELLAAAHALRNGDAVQQRRNFRVFEAPNPNVAAGYVATALAWYGSNETALLSPTRPATSPFVQRACARLEESPMTPRALGREVGPFRVVWERDAAALEGDILRHLAVPDDPDATCVFGADLFNHRVRGLKQVRSLLERHRRLTHTTEVTASRVRQSVGQACQTLRAHSTGDSHVHGLRCMTIHQAKNCEFSNVVLLWPYEVRGDEEKQRRLAYNAITRAQRRVTVVVQSTPAEHRSQRPPFSLLEEL